MRPAAGQEEIAPASPAPSTNRTRGASGAPPQPHVVSLREVFLLTGARRWLGVWWARLPGWGQALVIYGLSRIVDAVILSRVARFQPAAVLSQVGWLTEGTDPAGTPGYFGFVSLWDGEWYHKVAEYGYPDSVPRDDLGNVQQNAWAFYPLYPTLVRLLMGVTGAGWPVTASLVALVCGGVAAVIMRSLVEPLAGRSLALWTVMLFVAFPTAPVLQLAYTESLSLALLLGVLWTLQRGWYLGTAGLMLLVGLARPIAVPLAVVIGVHLLRQLYRWRRAPAGEVGPPIGRGSLLRLFVATAAAGAASVAWPVIAWRGTGEPNAYLETMSAWRDQANTTPFYPWWANARLWFGDWGGPLALAVVLVVLTLWLTGPRARLIAGDLRVWVVAYLGYLAAVLDLSTSLPRYLLLLFPLGTLLAAASPSRAFRWAVVGSFTAAQIVWLVWLWRISAPPEWPP